MLIRKAYRFALRADAVQEASLRQLAGSCRYVWNRTLALQKERLEAGEKVLRYGELSALLPEWKGQKETSWLKEANAQSLQQTLRDLDRALMEAFAKTNPKRFPRFKKRGMHDAFRVPQGFVLDEGNGRIRLPKLGWARYRRSRQVEGTPKNVTVSRCGGRWYVSIQVEMEVPAPVHPHLGRAVGVDLGVVRFATFSDGSYLPPLDSFRKLEKRLAREQRKLSRKVRFSSNWRKQKARVARVHTKIAAARNDFLHKASTTIAKNHGVVVLEDLRVSNMSASARGTLENPGRNVRAKSGLNKAILDQGWAEFRRQLGYKLEWSGGRLILVPPQYTSQRCPACDLVEAGNRRTQARFKCLGCGFEAHADFVGALNILAAGQAVLACGEEALAASVKQEPPGGLCACA